MEVSVLLLTLCNPLPTHTTLWVSTAREWLVLSGQLVTQIVMLSYEAEVVDPTLRMSLAIDTRIMLIVVLSTFRRLLRI